MITPGTFVLTLFYVFIFCQWPWHLEGTSLGLHQMSGRGGLELSKGTWPHRCRARVTRLLLVKVSERWWCPGLALGDPGSGPSPVTRGGLILPSLGSSNIPVSKIRRWSWWLAGSKPPSQPLVLVSQLLPPLMKWPAARRPAQGTGDSEPRGKEPTCWGHMALVLGSPS